MVKTQPPQSDALASCGVEAAGARPQEVTLGYDRTGKSISKNIPFLLLFFDGKNSKIQVFLERVSPGRAWDRVPIFRRRKCWRLAKRTRPAVSPAAAGFLLDMIDKKEEMRYNIFMYCKFVRKGN